MNLPLAIIRADGGTQPRVAINDTVVDDYATLMRAGSVFPPVTVYYDGTEYWLADGFHRLRAVDWIGGKEIECEIRQGTLQDAQWYSFSANKQHGLRRTEEDKQQLIRAALAHPMSAGMSDYAIAKHVGCSSHWVGTIRAEMFPVNEMPSMNKFIDSETRTVTRGGTTYQQNVTNIGRRPEAEEDNEPEESGPQPVKKREESDWECAIALTIWHSDIPAVYRLLRDLGFTGGTNSRKMRLPKGALMQEAS